MKWGHKVIHNVSQQKDMFISSLFNEDTFYRQFKNDLQNASKEIIIECPYLTVKRLNTLLPLFFNIKSKDVSIFIITRDPREHDEAMAIQSELCIRRFENMGIQVLLVKGGHHRKLAIIDRKVLWEGSLNILSQTRSREIMRRIDGRKYAMEMFNFLKFEKFT